jgi:hypothetical protein
LNHYPFTTFQIALTALSSFTNDIGACCIGGTFVDSKNCLGAIPHRAHSHGGVCKSYCYIHPNGGCHCHYLATSFVGTFKEEVFRVFGVGAIPPWSRVCNNFLFLPVFVADEFVTMPTTSFFDSTSS